jgi:hypothetical protein
MRQHLKTATKSSIKTLNYGCAMALCILAAAASGCTGEHDKRYYCTDVRFSIAFPQAWKITENLKGTRILAEIKDEEGIAIIRQNVNIVVEESSEQGTLNDYMEQQIRGLQKLKGMKILATGESTIDGTPARWLTYTYTIHDFGYQALVYALKKKNRFYVITGISQLNNFHKHELRFHQIAKSFRFE